jgi:hypothetical protein
MVLKPREGRVLICRRVFFEFKTFRYLEKSHLRLSLSECPSDGRAKFLQPHASLVVDHLSRERFQKRQGKELHLESRLVVEGSFLPVAALAASLLATLVTTALTTVAIK